MLYAEYNLDSPAGQIRERNFGRPFNRAQKWEQEAVAYVRIMKT